MNYEVDVASRLDCLDILGEPQLMDVLHLEDVLDLYRHLYTTESTYYLIALGKYKLLFTYEEREGDVFELHIACPKDSIIASRALCVSIMHWMFGPSAVRAEALITSCPEGKIANMIRKLGGVEVNQEGGLIYFMATAEEFKRNTRRKV